MKHQTLFAVLTEIVEVICKDHLDDTRIFPDNIKGVETLTIIPHNADYPKLIGKNGAQVRAMNYLVQFAARRMGASLAVSIQEGFTGGREPVEPFCYNPKFDLEAFREILGRLASAVTGEAIEFTITPSDQMIICRYPCERASENEALGGALTTVLRPYCFSLGRSLYIKPQFINQEHEPYLRH